MKRRKLLLRTTGGLVAAGVIGASVLAIEARAATRREYADAADAPSVSGRYGDLAGAPIRLAVLGDSTAAGLGVTRVEQTVGGRLAAMLADAGYQVMLDGLGVSGSRAADLRPQVSRALVRQRPDLTVLLIGANDATHLTALADVRRHLGDAVRRLRESGSAVVVGTCPDMGAVRALAQPLRAIVGWRGRQVADVSADAVTEAGGAPVDLAARTGPVFRADPGTLSRDAFHPSADGYGLWAMALYPAVAEAAAQHVR